MSRLVELRDMVSLTEVVTDITDTPQTSTGSSTRLNNLDVTPPKGTRLADSDNGGDLFRQRYDRYRLEGHSKAVAERMAIGFCKGQRHENETLFDQAYNRYMLEGYSQDQAERMAIAFANK